MPGNEKKFFEHTEFVSDSESQDPETVIQERQNPEIPYAHICKLAGTVNEGLSAVPEDQRETVEVYSVVDLSGPRCSISKSSVPISGISF